MAYVRDIMKKDIIAAGTEDLITEISKILTDKKMSNIPIVNQKGELVGVVSEQDIIKSMGREDFMKMTAKDIMTKDVLSVKENDCIEYVSKIFTEKPYRRLPVVRNKKVVGIITRDDIISSFMGHYY